MTSDSTGPAAAGTECGAGSQHSEAIPARGVHRGYRHEPPTRATRRSIHGPQRRPGVRRLGRGEPGRRRRGRHRGRRGHHVLRPQPHPRRRQARLAHRPAGPGPPRLRRQGRVRGPAVRTRHRERRHRRPLRRQQQLVRRVRVLVLQALRPRRRPAHGRRPQEVGARRAASSAPTPGRPREDARTPPASQDTSIRAFRDEVVAAIGDAEPRRRPLAATSSPAELLAPAHLPQEQSQRGGHIPTAINIPWSKAANEDGTFKPDDDLHELYADEGLDAGQGHDRVLPHRRALQPHLVRAPRAPRPPPTSRTTTARGPSTARSIGVPIEKTA